MNRPLNVDLPNQARKPSKAKYTYLLRAIDKDLWLKVRVKALKQKVSVRHVILNLLSIWLTSTTFPEWIKGSKALREKNESLRKEKNHD